MSDNLIPMNERTKEEQREIAKKGGKASVKSRRAKKTMQDNLKMMLELTLKDGDITEVEQIKSLADLKNANITVEQAILFAQLKKAMKGDTTSAVFVRDTSGNKLAEEMTVKTEVDATISEIEKYVDQQ